MNKWTGRAAPFVAACVLFAVPASASAGISDASASPGSASGAAIDYPGVITVSKSESGKDSSKATLLAVAGQDLIAHENGGYTGALAGVGSVTSAINQALCEGGALDPTGYCIVILHANSQSRSDPELGAVSTASTVVLGVNGPQQGINVAGSATASEYNAFTGECSDVSAGYLLITKKQFENPSKNGFLHRKAGSILQPCEAE